MQVIDSKAADVASMAQDIRNVLQTDDIEGKYVLILTVSSSRTYEEDSAGEIALELFPSLLRDHQKASMAVTRFLCKDLEVEDTLDEIMHIGAPQSLITLGGTGLTWDDRTPQAVRKWLDYEVPGFAQLITRESLNKTPLAALGRTLVGVMTAGRNGDQRIFVVCLPGSKKATKECFEAMKPVYFHAFDQISGKTAAIAASHATFHTLVKEGYMLFGKEVPAAGTRPNGSDFPLGPPPKRRRKSERKRDEPPVPFPHRRARESAYPMIPYEDAFGKVMEATKIDGYLHMVQNLEYQVPLGRHVNRRERLHAPLVAEPVLSPIDMPSLPTSIMDGYAFNAALLTEALEAAGSPEDIDVMVKGVTTAGSGLKIFPTYTAQNSGDVKSFSVVRISTGAHLPQDCDAVIPVEDTDLVEDKDNEEVTIKLKGAAKFAKEGKNVRLVGSDFKKNDVLLPAGLCAGPAAQALCLMAGVRAFITNEVKVTVFSTGNELRDPITLMKNTATFEHVIDTNRHLLIGSLEKLNFVRTFDGGILEDEFETVCDALEEAFAKSPVVICSGGVSMGEKDLIKQALIELGFEIQFGRVALKPGKPTVMATRSKGDKGRWPCVFFGLPGNPVSAGVTFKLFVRPFLQKVAGVSVSKDQLCTIEAQLTEDYDLDPRPELVRGTLRMLHPETSEDFSSADFMTGVIPQYYVDVAGFQRSSRLPSLAVSDVLIRMPAKGKLTQLKKDTVVNCLLLD
eukprot:Clim_evm19s148 gene=Clim_evmTU19s148